MKLLTSLLIIVSLWLTTYSATAQTPLTLNQYQEMAVGYSNSLKSSAENSYSSQQRLKMIRTGYYPSLSGSATANYQINYPNSITGTTLKDYSYASMVTLQQNVYTGGTVRANSRAAQINYDISLENARFSMLNVIYTANLTYWAFAASVEQVDIAQTYVDIVKGLYKIVKIRFDDGYISRTDLLMVETRLNESELQLITANKLYYNSLIALNTLVGNEQPITYSVGSDLSQLTPLEKVMISDPQIAHHPQYQAAELSIYLSAQNIKVARTSYNPQFNIGIQGIYGTITPNTTGNPKFYGVAFASFSVPIFMWGSRRHNVAVARSASRISEYTFNDTRDQLNANLQNAIINLEQTLDQSSVAQRNLSVAKENLDLNTFSYSEGKLPILDVLQSQLAWIQAYTAFVNSTYSYQTSVAQYRLAIGN